MKKQEQEIDVPKVFISYSHDNPEHKKWVAELAVRLRREASLDILIDQWDMPLGSDIGLFMENSVENSANVLMICSQTYTQKVNDGKGGAGYEGGIVRSEIIEKFNTNKFIPIIPPGNPKCKVPKCVATRRYVDMGSDETFDEKFKELVISIRQYHPVTKPTIGISEEFLALEQTKKEVVLQASKIPVEKANAIESYHQAQAIIRSNDRAEWQTFIRKTKKVALTKLNECRQQYECNTIITIEEASTTGEVCKIVVEAVDAYAPLFAAAVAGIESIDDFYRHQTALVADILAPSNWNRNVQTRFNEVPKTLCYVYHSIIGAAALKTRQFDLIFELANFSIVSDRRTSKLNQRPEIIGYQDSLDRNFVNSINFLHSLFPRWEFLAEVFDSQNDYYAALSAYNILLIFSDFVNTRNIPTKVDDYSLWSVPPSFLFTGSNDAMILAKQMLMTDVQQINNWLENNNFTRENLKDCWDISCKKIPISLVDYTCNTRTALDTFRDMGQLIVNA